jgi:HEPN domain-containing protein
MPRDSGRADSPERWLANARADFALARVALPPGGLFEHLCFHAQQAVEKSIKAVLIANCIEFPFTHSIQALLDLLPPNLASSTELADAVDLTPYAVAGRYPGESEPVTESDWRAAIHIAESVVRWADSVIRSKA